METSSYNKNNQIELLKLTLTRKQTKLDILALLEQFILYEDLFEESLSAKLIFRDQENLVGTVPIVGGEDVSIEYRTPIYPETIKLQFKVYKVGERGIPNSSENIQMNHLYLCTPEVWWAANNDVSGGYKGTYSDIISKLIQETGTKKPLDKEDSVGIVEYAAPVLNVFQLVKFCASRANSKTLSPMFFWETTTGYRFQSLKELYRAKYDKFLYIEDRAVAGVDRDANKVFNTIYSFDYPESNDRLGQYESNAFGATNFSVDMNNKRILKNLNDYGDVYSKYDIKLNKFPLNDDNKTTVSNIGFIPYRKDLSHISAFNRLSTVNLMDNLKLYVSIPGDSNLRTGNVLWLEIPSRVGLDIGTEAHSSGKWLVRSIKHLITKTTYTQTCELTKDSFDADVNQGG